MKIWSPDICNVRKGSGSHADTMSVPITPGKQYRLIAEIKNVSGYSDHEYSLLINNAWTADFNINLEYWVGSGSNGVQYKNGQNYMMLNQQTHADDGYALFDISFQFKQGSNTDIFFPEVSTILDDNGSGYTATLKASGMCVAPATVETMEIVQVSLSGTGIEYNYKLFEFLV